MRSLKTLPNHLPGWSRGTLNDFSDLSKLEFNAEDASTIGGYVTEQIGYLPQEGETTELHGYRVTITQCDGRRILEMRWQEIPEEESSEASAA